VAGLRSCGFATFDVDPDGGGDTTSIVVTHYGAAKGSPVYSQRDSFRIVRPRRHLEE
jgi:hypothetical protein